MLVRPAWITAWPPALDSVPPTKSEPWVSQVAPPLLTLTWASPLALAARYALALVRNAPLVTLTVPLPLAAMPRMPPVSQRELSPATSTVELEPAAPPTEEEPELVRTPPPLMLMVARALMPGPTNTSPA